MNIHIQVVSWQEAAEQIKPIREQVFIQEQHVPVELEWDEADHTAKHLIAITQDNRPIATARLLSNGHIGRMAVLAAYRHKGIGGQLLETLIEIARKNGLNEVFLHAQTHAIAFYAAHGFSIEGEEFMDAGIPHRTMRRRISS